MHVDVSAVDEDLATPDAPAKRARDLALAKARVVAARHPHSLVLAADTLIAFRGRLLGKPSDAAEAAEMLRALRGKRHRVITGVAVVVAARRLELLASEETRVLMRRYTDDEIAAYVASGDPMDKAAAYAIQNRGFHPVQMVDICYSNVMGLPLCATVELLQAAGQPVTGGGADVRRATCTLCEQARQL